MNASSRFQGLGLRLRALPLKPKPFQSLGQPRVLELEDISIMDSLLFIFAITTIVSAMLTTTIISTTIITTILLRFYNYESSLFCYHYCLGCRKPGLNVQSPPPVLASPSSRPALILLQYCSLSSGKV